MIKRVLLGGMALLVATCLPALAGKNGGGSIIVHTNDANSYTASVCLRFDTVDDPGSCELAGTRSDKDPATPALVWLIAAFDPTANPGVVVIYFGLNHNLPAGLGYFDRWGFCGPAGSLEIPDGGWPETGGNSVAFGIPVTGDTFFPYYYFNVFGDPGSTLGTGINPTGGYASFVDDSNPPFEDVIEHFGHMAWGADGANDCPTPPAQGACCLQIDASCVLTFEGDCGTMGGVYQGDGTACTDPTPCGACCYWGELDGAPIRQCVVTTENDCLTNPGWARQEFSDCVNENVGPTFGKTGIVCTNDPEQADVMWWCQDPRIDCDIAIEPTSWGQLKALYR